MRGRQLFALVVPLFTFSMTAYAGETAAEKTEEQAIIEEIGSLTRLWLGLDDEGTEYYNGLMDHWEACATKASLPVLEAFITRAAEFKKPEGYGPKLSLPWGIFGTLDKRIHELWWRLKTTGMTGGEKAKVALWAYEREEAKVPIDHRYAMYWFNSLDSTARGVVYEYLDRPLTGKWYEPSLTFHELVMTARDKAVFAPTDAEIERFLAAPGTVGFYATLGYLVTWQIDIERLVPHLRHLIETRRRMPVLFACGQIQYMKGLCTSFRPTLLELAQQEKVFAEGIWPQVPDEVEGRWDVFSSLAFLGEDPRTVEVFQKYIESVSNPEAWLGLSKDALGEQQRALDASYDALKSWGKLPERAPETFRGHRPMDVPTTECTPDDSRVAAGDSQGEQARPLSGRSGRTYGVIGLAAGLAVGAAGAWLLLRRRPGG